MKIDTLNVTTLNVQLLDSEEFSEIIRRLTKQENIMAQMDDKLSKLQAEVERNKSLEQSMLTLITGVVKQLEDVKAELKAKGVTDEQLQSLTAFTDALTSNDDALAAAIQANTPQADNSGGQGDNTQPAGGGGTPGTPATGNQSGTDTTPSGNA